VLLQITSLNVRLKDINDAGLTGGFGSDCHIHRNEKINFLNGRYGGANKTLIQTKFLGSIFP
jgi:hypothetical protein